MRFGDYIRDVRREHGWTQPDAAKRIGIEQSYLSKLESGKSFPSEEVFSSLLSVYALDLSTLTDQLFPAELDRLREISQVRASILGHQNKAIKSVQRWLVLGVCLLMFSGASFGAAWLGEDRVVAMFQYKSEGVILEGEGLDAFEIIGDTVADEDGAPKARQQEMIQRVDEEYQAIEDYRGVVFFETVSSGRRVWRFYGSTNEQVRSGLRWFLIPATMLLMGAFGCFFASYRSR
ncbi:MAG: hypothetical protein Hens2KO_23780 [Henriciella sp.]